MRFEPIREHSILAADPGGGVVGALRDSHVLAFARGLDAPVLYTAEAKNGNRAYPIAPSVYRNATARVGDCP